VTQFGQVLKKWPAGSKDSVALTKALRTIENCKCHSTLTDKTFEKAFNPMTACNSARKPPVPRAAFSVAPRGAAKPVSFGR
jgi:hypothetical protein